ncbi:hypothetical protein DFH09DRAFT_824006, partial [Mycena vulgaris]
ASAIITLMADHKLVQLVKAGTPTFYSAPHQTYSTIDLAFVSSGYLENSPIKCSTAPGHGSDHVCILTSFDLTVTHATPPPRRNWKAANWKDFQGLL